MGSRSTFRDRAGDVCYQKQCRDAYAEEGTPDVPHLDVRKARVRAISRSMAKQVILKYEWLGTMSNTGYHYGIFFGPYIAGVSCVSQGAAMAGVAHHVQFNIEQKELLTLARGACVHWAPMGTNSKLTSWIVRLLKKQKMGKLIWAMADTDAGEIGTIYQACGWVYIGPSGIVDEFVSPNGKKRLNQRVLSDYSRKWGCNIKTARARFMDGGWSVQHTNPKHRYVKIIDTTDEALAARIDEMSLPYPKRCAGSIVADAPADQVGEDGAEPIPALHSV